MRIVRTFFSLGVLVIYLLSITSMAGYSYLHSHVHAISLLNLKSKCSCSREFKQVYVNKPGCLLAHPAKKTLLYNTGSIAKYCLLVTDHLSGKVGRKLQTDAFPEVNPNHSLSTFSPSLALLQVKTFQTLFDRVTGSKSGLNLQLII